MTYKIICFKEIELPAEIQNSEPESARNRAYHHYILPPVYPSTATSYHRRRASIRYSRQRTVMKAPLPSIRRPSSSYKSGYRNGYSGNRAPYSGKRGPYSGNRRAYAFSLTPWHYRITTSTTTPGHYRTTTTTITTVTTAATTTTTTSTTTLVVNQSTIKEIFLEFSSLLKSTLFQRHLTEVQYGDQITKMIEVQLPPKIKMEFTLDANGEIQKICLGRSLFHHDIARLVFKRDFAAKLAGLNEPEKNVLLCK